MADPKSNKLMQHLNYRVRVTLQDTRIFIGTFKAFDKHMNLILDNCEEYRKLKKRGRTLPSEQTRVLGFVLLRGQNVVSITIEGPPFGEYVPRVPIPNRGGRGSSSKYVGGRGMSSVMPLVATTSDLHEPIRNIGGDPASSMVPNVDNNIPPFMGLPLFTQMMLSLPPTIKNGQPPMPGMGRGRSPTISGMGQMGPPPMPGLIPLNEMSLIRPPPLPEMSLMELPPLPELSPLELPPMPSRPAPPTGYKHRHLKK